MLWLLVLMTVVVTWLALRYYWGQAPSVPVVHVTEDAEPESLKSVSREEGLRLLEQLVDRKPVPENCEDVMYFLREFQKNKAVWGVTKGDLQSLYLRKCSLRQLWAQLNMTRGCCADYGKYLD